MKKFVLAGIILFLLVSLVVTFFLIKRNQDIRQRASEDLAPTPTVSCTPLQAVTGVLVEYPECDEELTCDFFKASCKWNLHPDAVSYSVTVMQVESEEVIISNELQTDSTSRITFPIEQNKTYKCSVTASSSCGSISPASSHQLFCEAEALIDTPTPTPSPTQPPPPSTPAPTTPELPTATPAPTNTPAPTATPTPTLTPTSTLTPTPTQSLILPTSTPTPTPTIAASGIVTQTLMIIGGALLVIAVGFLLISL